MLRLVGAIIGKDLRILLATPGAITQGLLLGLLIIFIFSMAKSPGELTSGREAAAIFWLASLFCMVLFFNQLYAIEESNKSLQGLILAPAPIQAVWLGKAVGGMVLILLAQFIFLPGLIVFLGQNIKNSPIPGLFGLFLTDCGMAALGSLLGSLAQGQAGRDSLLTIILFPLLLPLILAAVSLGACSLGESAADIDQWLGIAAAFDAIFIATGLFLSAYILKGDG